MIGSLFQQYRLIIYNFSLSRSLSIVNKIKFLLLLYQSLPWDRLVDHTAQSSRRRVYLNLSQPHRYKVKFP